MRAATRRCRRISESVLAWKQAQPANRLRLHDVPLSRAHSHTQRGPAISDIRRRPNGFVHCYVEPRRGVRTARRGREIGNGGPPRSLAPRGYTYRWSRSAASRSGRPAPGVRAFNAPGFWWTPTPANVNRLPNNQPLCAEALTAMSDQLHQAATTLGLEKTCPAYFPVRGPDRATLRAAR